MTAVFGGASSEAFDRLGPLPLLKDVGTPGDADGEAPWFGIVAAGGLLGGVAATEVAGRLTNPRNVRSPIWALVGLQAALARVMVVLGTAELFPIALGAHWMTTWARAAARPLTLSWLNRGIEPGVRVGEPGRRTRPDWRRPAPRRARRAHRCPRRTGRRWPLAPANRADLRTSTGPEAGRSPEALTASDTHLVRDPDRTWVDAGGGAWSRRPATAPADSLGLWSADLAEPNLPDRLVPSLGLRLGHRRVRPVPPVVREQLELAVHDDPAAVSVDRRLPGSGVRLDPRPHARCLPSLDARTSGPRSCPRATRPAISQDLSSGDGRGIGSRGAVQEPPARDHQSHSLE